MGKFGKKKETIFIKDLKFYALEKQCGYEVGDNKTLKEEKFFIEGEFLPDFKNGELGWFICLGTAADVPPGFPTWRSHGVVGVTGDTGKKPSRKDWNKEWGPAPAKRDWKEMLRMNMKLITPEDGGIRRAFTSATTLWTSIGAFYDDHFHDQQHQHPGQLLSMILKGWEPNTEVWNPDPEKTIYSPVFEPGRWMKRPENLPDEPFEPIEITSVGKVKDESGKAPKFADEEALDEAQAKAFGYSESDRNYEEDDQV
jgi:hypothetical protein